MIKIVQDIILNSSPDELEYEKQQLISDTINEIVRQVNNLKIGTEENAELRISYDGYSLSPFADFKINASSIELADKIQEIVNTASPY